uniref:Putative secreted peptide n=1 Tax=Anopheles braziliensis TaxID=58242 RepID=A0A2M3ZVB8_9DIPT
MALVATFRAPVLTLIMAVATAATARAVMIPSGIRNPPPNGGVPGNRRKKVPLRTRNPTRSTTTTAPPSTIMIPGVTAVLV